MIYSIYLYAYLYKVCSVYYKVYVNVYSELQKFSMNMLNHIISIK